MRLKKYLESAENRDFRVIFVCDEAQKGFMVLFDVETNYIDSAKQILSHLSSSPCAGADTFNSFPGLRSSDRAESKSTRSDSAACWEAFQN
jgi:hypothetical protein